MNVWGTVIIAPAERLAAAHALGSRPSAGCMARSALPVPRKGPPPSAVGLCCPLLIDNYHQREWNYAIERAVVYHCGEYEGHAWVSFAAAMRILVQSVSSNLLSALPRLRRYARILTNDT